MFLKLPEYNSKYDSYKLLAKCKWNGKLPIPIFLFQVNHLLSDKKNNIMLITRINCLSSMVISSLKGPTQ